MTFNTLPKFAGALFKWISRIACGLLILLTFNSTTLAVDLLYVSNGNTIVSYETTGIDGVTIAATMTTFANMGGSSGLAFDLSGNLYVSQMGNDTIRKFNSSGAYVSIINTNLSGPSGLACDTSGNLYAANHLAGAYGNTISKFDSSGVYVSSISSNLSSPRNLSFDTSGNLYAANPYGSYGNTISKFDSSGVYVSNISSNLSSPYGQTFDTLGNLYTANFGGNSISKFDSSGVYLSNITTNLFSPSDLAFDSLGNLYAVNYTSNTISKFDSSGTFLTSWSTGYPLYSLAFRPVSVPEPSTYALATIATGVMAYLGRRKARIA